MVIIVITLERRGALTVDIQLPESEAIDGQKPNDHCAVAGYLGKSSAYSSLITILRTLQHRGQESAGIAIFNNGIMNVRKGMGLVNEVFANLSPDQIMHLDGNVGIGHTRYSTAGTKTMENAGPFIVTNSAGYFAVSHNGEITNADKLREELMKQGLTFSTTSDTEVLLMELARNISLYGISNGTKLAMEKMKGAYAVALLFNGRLFALRDPLGIRPLILGKTPDGYIVASESCALDVMGAEKIRDVRPGELVELTPNGIFHILGVTSRVTAHCMFEYVYFARPDSVIDNVEVFQTRIRLGKKLAEEFPVDADVVVPVPDSGRAQALGYSIASGIPYSEGLIKNRFSDRTFIMPTQEKRAAAVRIKLNVIASEIKDKRVVLVDDSIVRGNTMKFIVSLLKKAGAKEVHVRIGSPPIIAPCYFGVDMKTRDQFVATGRTEDDIRDLVGADSLRYVSIDGLVESTSMSKNELCLGCLTSEYPAPIPGVAYPEQKELESFTS